MLSYYRLHMIGFLNKFEIKATNNHNVPDAYIITECTMCVQTSAVIQLNIGT